MMQSDQNRPSVAPRFEIEARGFDNQTLQKNITDGTACTSLAVQDVGLLQVKKLEEGCR